jgi:hypothetical protein
MAVSRQNADGTWSPAEPVGWFDTIDWEVTGRGRDRAGIAYWHATELARVRPGAFFGLRLRLAHRRLVRGRRP